MQMYIINLINKNEKAFKLLVEIYQAKVLNTCLGILQNAEDAEDISQEVFISI